MPRLALSLLGPFHLSLNDKPVRGFEADKVRALLAYLVVEHHHAHRREFVGELLWPGRPKGAVHSNLRKALFRLRQVIGDSDTAPSYLLTTQKTIQWNADSDCWVDVTAFESLIESAGEHEPFHPEDCGACKDQLKRAIELYRGDFLANLYLEDSIDFEDWAAVKRESLRWHVLEALERLSVHHREHAEYKQAIVYARRRTTLDPLNEEAHCRLMEALALAGQRSEALAQFRRCCNILASELSMEPSEGMIKLRDRILCGEL